MQFVGIDYSGAQTAWTPLRGLQVYLTDHTGTTSKVEPPTSQWTRAAIATWLTTAIREQPETIVGIDHCLGFPRAYHEQWGMPASWRVFAADLRDHWPAHLPGVTIDMIRTGVVGAADQRSGSALWRRECEKRCGAKSVFHFDVPGSVAKSSFTGIPWALELACAIPALHVWPFDGWIPPHGAPLLAECYPTLYRNRYDAEDRTADQHDAYSIARWLFDMHQSGQLGAYFKPPTDSELEVICRVEGWILGVDEKTKA